MRSDQARRLPNWRRLAYRRSHFSGIRTGQKSGTDPWFNWAPGIFHWRGRAIGLDLDRLAPDAAAKLIRTYPKAARHLLVQSSSTICAPRVVAALNRTGNRLLSVRIRAQSMKAHRFRCAAALRHSYVYLTFRGHMPLTDLKPFGKRLIGLSAVAWRYDDKMLEMLRAFPELRILELYGLRMATAQAGESIAALLKLTRLALTQVSFPLASVIARLKRLRELEIGLGKLDRHSLQQLGKRRLWSLSLFGTNLTDDDLAQLWKLKGLRYLNLGATKIRGPGLSFLRFLPRLRVLDLNGNDPRGKQHLDTTHLGRLQQLRELRMPFFNLVDADLRPLQHLRKLRVLSLFSNRIKGPGLRYLQRSPLTELVLTYNEKLNQLTGLKRQMALRRLSLGNTAIGLLALTSVSKLRILRVHLRVARCRLAPIPCRDKQLAIDSACTCAAPSPSSKL